MYTAIMILYYIMSAFFALCFVVEFARTRNIQKAILYLVILMPFVMRLARLK
jgi:hypothetical protein